MEQSCHFQGLGILTLTDISSNNMDDFEQAHNKNSTQTGGERVYTADIAGYGYICFHCNLSQFMCAHDLVVPFMSKAFV